MGRDITHADLSAYYHAIIYAVGARTDRRMGIPPRTCRGATPPPKFVGWYNAHPDFRHLHFDLKSETAAVVGSRNVAMDLARILASPRDVLAQTDIAEHALQGSPRPASARSTSSAGAAPPRRRSPTRS